MERRPFDSKRIGVSLMNYKKFYPWKVGVKEAIKIQQDLRRRVILKNTVYSLRLIAGVDVGFFDNRAKAVVCVFGYPELKLIELKTAYKDIDFPYLPGLLSFREGPVILAAFKKIKNIPDVILFDGQGICHPRRIGLASHLGLILDTAAIGCTKNIFFGRFDMPKEKRASFSYIYDKENKEILGVALRTRSKVKPIFISPGFKINLEKSKEIVLKLCKGFRIPEPLRIAHHFTKNAAV